MAKDPAFLFYSAEASEDVSHMNRLERGAYFDFLQAQRKFHGITTEQARKILGKDFEDVWPALEMILSCEDSKYFIPWMREGIKKRKEHAELQRKKIQDYWDKKKAERNNRGNSTELPLRDGIGDRNGNTNEITKEGKIDFNVFWNSYGKQAGNIWQLEIYWYGLLREEQQKVLDFIPVYKKYEPRAKFRLNPENFFANSLWTRELPEKESEALPANMQETDL